MMWPADDYLRAFDDALAAARAQDGAAFMRAQVRAREASREMREAHDQETLRRIAE
ncbi:hypothetical protein [Bradyrhizobium sp. SZCCHNR1020]|uniref:hypothetical protein n=1 Tax=Bradyrhizobium sp. SZCCHNR1020 TaxID=3057343 RepID=UPI002915FC53|nr:hypothetical protein [Bradyrhizobium sp. SZCCHNR1020]